MSTPYIHDDCYDQCANDGMLTIDNILVNNIKLAESQLSSEHPYVFYDLTLLSTEVHALNSLMLNEEALKQFDHFEAKSTTNNIKEQLMNFFKAVSLSSNTNLNTTVNLINRIFMTASSYNNENEIALFDLRVSSSNIGYGVPHDWHTDDIYAECQHRNFITLVGPSTLFYNDINVKDQILSGQAEMSEILALKTESSSYSVAGENLIDYSKVERASFGQGAIFYQGTNDAALHTGPRETFTNRITVIIDKCDISVIPKILENQAGDDTSRARPIQ